MLCIICNLKYSFPKKTPIYFHIGSNYDYHFIIKVTKKEFKKQFTFLGENNEKHVTFTVPIEKEVTKIDKNGDEITKNRSYILQFIDSQDLWQANYQILSIIFLEEFIELHVNSDMTIKLF